MISVHGHSATVKLRLIAGDREYSLARVGPDEVGLSEHCEPTAPTIGVIVVSIDGVENRRDVFFPNGIGTDGDRVVYF
jgi:hypothetical protein